MDIVYLAAIALFLALTAALAAGCEQLKGRQ